MLANEKRTSSLETLWERMDEDLRHVLESLDQTPLSHEMLERDETREMVNTTMSQLPTAYRSTLEAKYLEHRSVRQIAADQATTEKAVESQLSRARQAFRESFLALTKNLQLEANGQPS